MSIVKWSRPDIKLSKTLDKRVHVSQRLDWREALAVLGRLEMDLRRKHAELRATDRRALNGTVEILFKVTRHGDVEVISTSSDDAVVDLEPYVASLIANATFPRAGTDVDVRVTCTFDSDRPVQGRQSDPFAIEDDDPFANPYAEEAGGGDRGFGDPF